MIIRKENFIYLLLVFLLAIIAGGKFFGSDNDTSHYYDMVVRQSNISLSNKEIFFKALIYMNSIFFDKNFYIFLFIFALISISIKFYVFANFSPLPILSILLYLLSYFWLHDYIQIRAGVATGIFLLATKDLAEGNTRKYFFKVFFAIMFHWSSIVLIPLFYLIKHMNFKQHSFLPFLGISLKLLGINFIFFIQFILQLFRIDPIFYKMYAGYQNSINAFNLISLSYIITFYIITYIFLKYKESLCVYEVILYKLFSIGIFVFFITSLLNAPVVAFRLLEYFMIVLLLLIPFVVMKFKQIMFVSTISVIYYGFYCYYLFYNVIELK